MSAEHGAFRASSLRPQRRAAPGRRAIAASVVLHGGVIALALVSAMAARPQPIDFKVYRVDIVSPPPAPQPEPVVEDTPAAEEPVVDQPPAVVEDEPAPEPEAEEPEPEPEVEQPEPTPPQREQPESEQPEPTPPQNTRKHMDATALSGEDLRILMEGLESEYSAYFENVVLQIRRYFRPPANVTASAEYFFYINRDGSVSDIRLVRSSGNAVFNIQAMGAIEAAGSRGAFGPLPAGFEYDRLPFLFYFEPPQ